MGPVIYVDPYGSMTFVPSKVKKNADFFRIYEEKEGVLNVKKQSSKVQEMCLNDAGTETNLASLWYTPHLTEILVKLAPVEVTLKPTTDTSKKLFRNSFVYGKSLEIYTMLYQTYMMIKAYAKMLQSSQRYSAHGNSIHLVKLN